MFQDLEKIKYFRKKIGLTQFELAKLSGVSQSMIAKIEREKIEPSYSIAVKIFTTLEKELSKNYNTLTAKDIINKKIISVDSGDNIENTILLMKKHAISQLPVIKNKKVLGSISEETLVKNYDKLKNKMIKVKEIMDEPFPRVPENTSIFLIRELLKEYSAVLTINGSNLTGIITKSDLLKDI